MPATKNSDGGYDVESDARQEFDAQGDDEVAPVVDDGLGGGDGDDYDDDGGGKSAEASYDPDFDN